MIQRPGKFLFTKGFLKIPLLGAFQVRYMPLALSLNSDCLKFQLFPLQNPPCDRHCSSLTCTSQFLYSCPQPLGQCSAFQQVFLFLLHRAWEDTPKKQKRTKKPKKQNTKKKLEKIWRGIPSWQAVHLCRAGINPSKAVLVLSNAGARGSCQVPAGAGREPHT